MANKKFSEFTVKTDPANVDFLVGYDGTDNVRIDPSNLGGGGASDLNGLSDVSIDLTNDNAFFINIPSGVSGAVGNIGLGEEALNSLTSGDYNTAIGKQALNNSTTSERSTAIGYNAGASAGTNLQLNAVLIGDNAGFGRSGYRTVAVGSGAMSFGLGKSAVNRNTAIGYHALYRIDTNGADNIAIGHEASQFLTTATTNIAIGDNAARSSTANGHISIGYHAGYSQTSGGNNTNLGYRAGYYNTTGAGRVAIGSEAGFANTGTRNVFIGDNAGAGSGSGAYNAVVGTYCLYSANAGSNNSILGYNAMPTATGDNNVAVGYQAGNAMTTGGNNTLMGYQAGDAITTGGSNVAIGTNALGKTTSSQLTAIGDSAGSENISGQKNVYIGYAAGQGNATGFNNCYVGYAAGAQNQSGDRNTALGTLAGLGTFLSASIGNNTSLGYAAGTALSTGGDGNTLVGCFAGNTLTTGSNNLILGESSAPSSVTVDNEITLGNSSISALRCAVTSITSLSDERDKSEIKDLEYGLAFIDALQPREFVWDNRVETRTEYDDDGNETQVEFYSANKGKKDFGFIAQEVRELDNDTLRLVYTENEDKLEMSYGKLVPILVKAVQELKEEVELLKS